MAAPSGRPPFAPDDLSTVLAIEDDRTMNYAEWEDQANRLASALAAQGVHDGDTIAVRLHVRLEWLVVSLALAKLDAIMVAVNYRSTAREARHILTDCGVRALILDDAEPDVFATEFDDLGLLAVVAVTEKTEPGILRYSDLIAQGASDPRPADDLARMVIYTSGTTGAPKGVLRDLRSLSPARGHKLAEYARSLTHDGAAGGPGSRSLVSLPFHHSMGPHALRTALSTGGVAILQRRFDAEHALALTEQHGITDWTMVPTMLQRILSLHPETRTRYDLSTLKCVELGGAPAGPELTRRFIRFVGHDCLYSGYGLSEAGMVSGAAPSDQRNKPGTCGRPFKHVDVRIVDESDNSLPAGEDGEILVRTPLVIDGYIGRGPLGPDKVTPDGFYRTGDVGHLDQDGYLYIVDRKTDMIIAGGANIYPAEIEAVLEQHPAVSVAAVIGVPHPDLGEQPEAYVELASHATATPQEILAFCDGKLAKYKWPRHIHVLDAMPASTHEKVLKTELRARWKAEQAAGSGLSEEWDANESPDTLPGSRDSLTGELYVPARRFAADGSLRECRTEDVLAQGTLVAATHHEGVTHGLIDLDAGCRIHAILSPEGLEVGAHYVGHSRNGKVVFSHGQ
ncbi:class I adenylate-forming enzyme family protein [Streptomyces griseorubiginosus]|uniref:class I adenylate-forming enzyme family protein n=1 Tax=Streptomyces griseorubiginosus TaxID=67304 RepID=UPI001AD6F66A|nr:class I adenylate-forming enzyme family protein [Streptomyces griseorubiginosus]MBO4256222.1 AMP-binding protein [Streptomyces griseorubiginosus]